MYEFENYHDFFYQSSSITEELKVVINKYNNLKKNTHNLVCDYGCGNGSFLKELDISDKCVGVEFTENYTDILNKKYQKKIKFINTEIFFKKNEYNASFDFIFLNDVLEHVPYPKELLINLSNKLKKGGKFIITGPVEENYNLIYYFSKMIGHIKNFFKIKNTFIPYHLYRTSNFSQKYLFNKVLNFKLLSYETYETGWPYKNNGLIRNFISNINFFVFPKKNHYRNNRFIGVLEKIN
tara:strand:+ start:5797 stop:6510 length:714 start_codon:yes stop_codon:yes gene_type:complete